MAAADPPNFLAVEDLPAAALLAGRDLPLPREAVALGRDQVATVGGEREVADRLRIRLQANPLLAGVGVPKADRVIASGRGQQAAVGRIPQPGNGALAAIPVAQLLAGGGVPEADVLVIAAGGGAPGIGRQGDRRSRAWVAQAHGAKARDGAFRQWVVIAGRGVDFGPRLYFSEADLCLHFVALPR